MYTAAESTQRTEIKLVWHKQFWHTTWGIGIKKGKHTTVTKKKSYSGRSSVQGLCAVERVNTNRTIGSWSGRGKGSRCRDVAMGVRENIEGVENSKKAQRVDQEATTEQGKHFG